MSRKVGPLLPATEEFARRLGERLRLARRRRRLTARQVADRAGMAPMTLRSVERGSSGATIGAYLAVMQVLGVEADIDLLVQADPMGRALQDARLSKRRQPPAARTVQPPAAPATPMERTRAVAGTGGFASARSLARLLDVSAPGRQDR